MAGQTSEQMRRRVVEAVSRRPAACPGVVAQWAVGAVPQPPVVAGDAVRWIDATRELPDPGRMPMTAETMFDIASLTKIFTAVIALRVLPRHGIGFDDPVASLLPELRDGRQASITWRNLLTHTSGLPAETDVWRTEMPVPERRQRVLRTPPVAGVGVRHQYSCVGYLVLAMALEHLAGTDLDSLVRQEITDPLGMTATRFGPIDVARHPVAATEFSREPNRGMIHGSVHDESAWSLGGICGNAGLFSTAADLLRLGLALTGEGTLLTTQQRTLMTSDQLGDRRGAGYGQAFGLRVGDPACVPAELAWCGHTGFTGTSLVLDPASGTVGVLLTNRVHPRRERCDIGPLRRRFTAILAGVDSS